MKKDKTKRANEERQEQKEPMKKDKTKRTNEERQDKKSQ
jgi:hypothetical protein